MRWTVHRVVRKEDLAFASLTVSARPLAEEDYMKTISNEKLESLLGGFIADGFNRSIGALVKAGALDTKKMMSKYKGMGSEYYDLVTEQIEYTARFGAQAFQRLLSECRDEDTIDNKQPKKEG